MRSSSFTVPSALATALLLAAGAAAQPLSPGYVLIGGNIVPPGGVSSTEVDLGIGFDAGAFDLHIHDEGNAAEYSPSEAALFVPGEAAISRPVSSAFNFTGVGAGQDLWRLPQTFNPDLLYTGIGAEEIAPGTFQPGSFGLRLVGVAGGTDGLSPAPGFFSMWASTDTGPAAIFASADGISAADTLSLVEGSHSHYNFGFSQPGWYAVTVEASAVTVDGSPVSGQATYYFQVVPTPGAAAVLGAGALLAARRRRN